MKDKFNPLNLSEFHSVMIAGTHSGVGKTTWSLALMALGIQKGLVVQPFKAGPDYIDTGFHHQICQPRKSRNLDLFLLSKDEIVKTFYRNNAGSQLAIVEGMMGLFDGRSPSDLSQACAGIAKVLKLPVILVIDGSNLATGAAAMVLGFQKFDQKINLAGVVINRVNHEKHFQWLKECIEAYTGVPCLGYLPDQKTLTIPERHLGLVTANEGKEYIQNFFKITDWLNKHFDWETFLKISEYQISSSSDSFEATNVSKTTRCRIAIAYDAAFSFYYEDNFDLLRQNGAELTFFSPLMDKTLPENTDLLYLGGGFPELYAGELSKNFEMIQAIDDFYEHGGLIYGECGGLIYLTEIFCDSQGKEYPFVGLIPGKVTMTNKLQHFGYHEVLTLADSFLFPAGMTLRSHEFHYSTWSHPQVVPHIYKVAEHMDGFFNNCLLASYQHLHFGSDPILVRYLIENCEKVKHRRQVVAI